MTDWRLQQLLEDYQHGDRRLYAYAPGWTKPREPDSELRKSLHFDGYGQWKRFGLGPKSRLHFIAVYYTEYDLVLEVDGNGFSLSDYGHRFKLVPRYRDFARYVEISDECGREFHGLYWSFCRPVWPDDGDIFSFVARVTKDRNATRQSIVWHRHCRLLVAEGWDQTVEGFYEEVDARVASELGATTT